jgi:hypothetical protein
VLSVEFGSLIKPRNFTKYSRRINGRKRFGEDCCFNLCEERTFIYMFVVVKLYFTTERQYYSERLC